jgi:hypothetical protein
MKCQWCCSTICCLYLLPSSWYSYLASGIM